MSDNKLNQIEILFQIDMVHPAEDIYEQISKKLRGKTIVLAITGSIAAVESIRLARQLIRHGAKIIPVMTPAATEILHPYALEFATGQKPICNLTGQTEHVTWCGKTKNPCDLLLISPCTANTISKITNGIDDTAVTTFTTTAIGSHRPIILVPAMHKAMYDHQVVQQNLTQCQTLGIEIVEPKLVGNKAKMPEIDTIVASVIRKLGKNDFSNKKMLIIGGATAEPIDDIRVVTNRSSGKTAHHLAISAYERGANVELWYGWSTIQPPPYISIKRFETLNDLEQIILKNDLSTFDIIIVCAALADYIPDKKPGKIPSGQKNLTLHLTSAPKLLKQIREKAPNTYLFGFKVEETEDKIQKKAKQIGHQYNLDLVIGNTITGFQKEENTIWIFDKTKELIHTHGKKIELSHIILNAIVKKTT